MSTDLEGRVTAVLYAEAGAAPPAGDLLAGVHARARVRSRRRAAFTGTVAVLVIAAGAAVVSIGAGRNTDTLRPPTQFAHPGADPLVAGAAPALQFPYSPGWLPDGVATTPQLSLTDSGLQALWNDATPGQDGALPGVALWSADRDVSLRGDGVTRRPTTFAGHAAVLASTQGLVSLGWEQAPGSWRVVDVENRFASEANARHVASALVEKPVVGTSPYTMTLVPRDSVLARWTTYGWWTFVAKDELASWRDDPAPNAVLLMARRLSDASAGHGDAVVVQGHSARISQDAHDGWTLTIQLNDKTVLVVTAPASWSREDVLRLGEATHYNGGLPPPEG
jgi:hypothetical protein